ncbi:CopD family protein [Legionella nagasakiensis]|uniref:CopD family protein n=1 Tax=Legionella nagasakiensis TaxID=535290 RepID=UPI001054F23C|nr:CopD family protein [Legionella nagasakiensis]
MNWLLLLHISAMLCWCGALIYLPALIFGTAAQKIHLQEKNQAGLLRMVFNLILTPAALMTIVSGTLVFIKMRIFTVWLMLKLTLVVGLVICHVFNGWLILRMEERLPRYLSVLCFFCGIFSIVLILAIIWLVLAKPHLEVLL